MKACSKCKLEKPASDFYARKSSRDGLRSNCKSCIDIYRIKIKAQTSEYNRQYKIENKESLSAKAKEYRRASDGKIKEAKRRYSAANKEKIAARDREYKKSNPEKSTARSRNRRARERNAEGSHTGVDVLSIFISQRGLCANCNSRLFKSGANKYHVDHVMPLALGGTNWPSNLQCLCPRCNMSKNAKDPIKWANENGRLI